MNNMYLKVTLNFLILKLATTFLLSTHIKNFLWKNSGAVRGGSGVSADPPKMFNPVEEKLEIKQPDPPKSRARQSDPPIRNF